MALKINNHVLNAGEEALVSKLLKTHPFLHNGDDVITDEETKKLIEWVEDGKVDGVDLDAFNLDRSKERISGEDFVAAFKILAKYSKSVAGLKLGLFDDKAHLQGYSFHGDRGICVTTNFDGKLISGKMIQYNNKQEFYINTHVPLRENVVFEFGPEGGVRRDMSESCHEIWDLDPGSYVFVAELRDKVTGKVLQSQKFNVNVEGRIVEESGVKYSLYGFASKMDEVFLKDFSRPIQDVNRFLDIKQAAAKIWFDPVSIMGNSKFEIATGVMFDGKSENVSRRGIVSISYHEIFHRVGFQLEEKDPSFWGEFSKTYDEMANNAALYKVFDESNYMPEVDPSLGHLENAHELFASTSVVVRVFSKELIEKIDKLSDPVAKTVAIKIVKQIVKAYSSQPDFLHEDIRMFAAKQ